MNAAILYFRVSKKDGTQTTANQQPEVEQLVAARGFRVVGTYVDNESAVKRRPGLEAMLADLRKGKHGPAPVVVLWSLDRLGRGLVAGGNGGFAGCFDTYRTLVSLGARPVSVKEPWLDVDGPARDLLVAVMSWVSGWERDRLIQRTRAGLERARREGKRLGRPRTRLPPPDLERALALKAEGWGSRRIVGQLKTKCAASTLDLLLAQHGTGPKKGHSGPAADLAETTASP